MAIDKASEFEEKQIRFARLSKALSHPARIAILEILAEQESCMCGDITQKLPLAQSTVSQHLKVLKDSGVITGRIDGLSVCYDINPKAIRELDNYFREFSSKLTSKDPSLG